MALELELAIIRGLILEVDKVSSNVQQYWELDQSLSSRKFEQVAMLEVRYQGGYEDFMKANWLGAHRLRAQTFDNPKIPHGGSLGFFRRACCSYST